MKSQKEIKGAAALGVKVRRDKSLDKFSGTVLFPEKLREANKFVARIKWKAI